MPFSLRVHAGALLACFASAAAIAQSATPQSELRAYVGMKGTVPLPDAGAFGEQINPISGELALVQTDVWLNTNGFPLSMTRSFTPGNYSSGAVHSGAFGDWQLELPRMTTLTVRGKDGHGWQVAGTHPYARCSAFAAPPTQSAAELKEHIQSLGMIGIDPVRDPGGNPIRSPGITPGEGTALDPDAVDPNVWWQGYQLIVPGQGEQEILRRDAANALAAEDSPQRYPLLTAQQWQIGCLDQTDNDEPGEAFIAMAPDGTKYTFNHLVYESVPSLDLANLGTVARERATLLVTRIEDRFGNAQEFVYDGDRLVTVVNPTEVQLDLHYRTDVPSLVDQVILRPYTSKPRKWSYQYANLGTGRETLTGVTRPDGTAWGYKLQDLADATLTYNGTTTCSALAPFDAAQTFTGTLSDPNGLTEQLVLAGVRHGRTHVANACGVSGDFPWKPSQYDTLSLVQRSESGANMGTPTWTYRYAKSSESSLWMEVVDPSQRVTRFTFSNVADETEGHLLALDTDRHAEGSASRSLRFDYAASNAGPYPSLLGNAVGSRVNNAAFSSVMPLAKQTLTQDGDSYVTENLSFNAFGQPTQVRRSNTIAGQPTLETHIDYLNDLPHWVLGLPQSITNTADNTVISQNVYDLAKVTLKEHHRFGLRQASYTYDAQGHVASVTDGNGLATQYKTYVMGSPATTVYPDGTSENNWPDDFGNVTTHIDRAGVTTTAEYDVMGRITHLHEPQGDSTVWNDTDYSYVYAEQPGTGISGAHWRYTENRGSAGSYVDYDALMRPILRASRAGPAGAAAWITQAQAYDWRGRAVFASYRSLNVARIDQLTQGIRTDYDALDRPVASHQDSEQGVLTTALAYLSGARTQQTDPKGGVTTTQYHVLDAPGTANVLRIDAPEGITQTVTRDVYGAPLTLTQSGLYQNAQVSLTRVNYYDSAKRLCRTWNPETGSTVFDYDAGSRETWRAQVDIASSDCGRELIANGTKTQRSYDAMDRVTAISYPGDSSSAQFTYDLMGRLTSADTGLSRWTYAYNHLGLPVGETLVVDGLPFNLAYTYDGNGGLASVTYPDGRLITYAPDAWGRPTQAGIYANSARYLPNGKLEYFKYGNGIEYVTEQNARQLPSNLSYALPSGNLLFSQDFGYDQTGNLTQANDLLQGVGSQRTFQYDTLNRLTNTILPGATNSESYSYDPLNNLRRIVNGNGLVRDYTYDPDNRLSRAMGSDAQMHSFDYDWRGNITRRDDTPFTFDFANRLIEVSGKERYVYDAFGRRVLKTRLGVGGNKSYYVYSNQNGQLMLQRDNNVASSETDYIYLGGMLVAQATTRKHDLPGAISFVPASPSNGNYNIAWGVSQGATRYELQEQYNGDAWDTIYSGAQSSLDLNGRQGGTYLYQIRACATTCGGWVVSSPMGVTPARVQTIHVPGSAQRGSYSISWDPTIGATSYDVDELDNGSLMPIPRRVASDTTSTSLQLPGNTSGFYSYRVLAKSGYGNRGWSDASAAVQVEVSPSDPPPTLPASPTFVTPPPPFDYPVARFPANVVVEWNPVARASRYEITIVEPNVLYTTTDIRQLVGITQAGSYYVSVRACNDVGCSGWSRWGPFSMHLSGGGPGGGPAKQSTKDKGAQAHRTRER
ncbi:RHS repeat protein [Dyella monticola]|uniref:RHS repeat protein n=1 Tax=Dyella monticola TaxID=1927958 RepID=A0A370X656_9GAMM|nr:RHS repeat protein [Dyella monticola]RDS83760.1 RHS repeat protein [Dyella monticola]